MNIEDITVNQTELAEIFGLTTRQVRNLTNNGILTIVAGETPSYGLLDSVRAYVKFLKRPKSRRKRIISVRPVGMNELRQICNNGVMGGK